MRYVAELTFITIITDECVDPSRGLDHALEFASTSM